MSEQETRPLFGQLTRRDGTVIPLVFHRTDDPQVLQARYANDERPVRFQLGDRVAVDKPGVGRLLEFQVEGKPT